jgi:hypothetical protein
MLSWILTALCTAMLTAQTEGQGQPASQPANSQPSTRPAETAGTLRKPTQASILKGLLRQAERPEPIRPVEPTTAPAGGVAHGADGQPLFLEGTMLVERRGRLIHEDGRAKFVLYADVSSPAPRTLEIIPSQLLEAMEREGRAGFSEFIVTAEVTRYKDRNYLILRKILRRVGHGNLGP